MRTVAQIQSIRFLHEREGWSMRRIARELHVSRETVRRCLDRSDGTAEPKYTRSKPVPHPKMGPYQELIDAWLESDQHAPKKQRHTARRICHLCARSTGPRWPNQPSARLWPHVVES